MNSNFIFLKSDWKYLADIGELAEITLKRDPNTALIKLRQLGEYIGKAILKAENIIETEGMTQLDRIRILKREEIIDGEMEEIFHLIRKRGNEAVHESYGEKEEAELILSLALKLSAWFKEVYGSDLTFDSENVQYHSYQGIDYEAEYKKLMNEVKKEEKNIPSVEPARNTQERIDLRKNLRKNLHLSEKETRFLIDNQLREAGWTVDTDSYNYKTKGTLPEKGKFMAIAEWPCKKENGVQGYADYAFFLGKTMIGILEAKKYDVDIPAALRRDSRMYAKGAEIHGEAQFHQDSPFGEYRVPFMFASNGRVYSHELPEKSGVWFLDGRAEENQPKPLKGFYSPKDLKALLEKDEREANQRLKNDSIEYLKSKSGLNLRDYQIEAVKSVEEALMKGQNKILLTMATGTGKTRTALGILYRLLKSGKYNRILFVVDRGALGEQAMDTFKNAKVESLQTLAEIYDVKGLTQKIPEDDTRVHIATVQGLIKRIMYNSEDKPTVGQYDCIIIDEAHRGYILDRSMDEEDYDFKNEVDFQSKYRNVVEYFQADKIALTATPAVHTYQIFGDPVYEYSYRQAVIDGYLVDFEPPYMIETQLSKKGINYEIGETVAVYDVDTKEINKKVLEDELNFEVEAFNKKVITENFNRVVCSALVDNINPEGPEKTLIFAANDEHADLVVRLLREEYQKKYHNVYELNNDMIEKITGSIKDANQMIKKFKNEVYPTIAVTVDLLTTGVDVPTISNLVFLRKVKSRILYEQMIGRGTRRCDEIGKDCFKIFDAVDLYKDLEGVTSMKPVVTSPKLTFEKLLENLEKVKENSETLERFRDEIVGKLQRKNRHMDKKGNEYFQVESKAVATREYKELDEFIDDIKCAEGQDIYRVLKENTVLLKYMDNPRLGEKEKVISSEEDELIGVVQNIDGKKPEDYLESFKKYIEENQDSLEGIKLLKTHPEKLTRKDLKELEKYLDLQGFKVTNLNAAYKLTNNQEIVTGMLAYIKNVLKGSPIKDHRKKVQEVMEKIYSLKLWNKGQKTLLERIEKQLIENEIITESEMDSGIFKQNYGGFQKIDKNLDGMLREIIDLIKDEIIIN